jgi:uncharacterized protein (TIGR02266 family)
MGMSPGAKYRAGSPTPTVSGLRPRVSRNEPPRAPDDFEAVDPAAVLEQRLADTQVELETTRRERDAIEQRLVAALLRLSELENGAVAPPIASEVTAPQPARLPEESRQPVAILGISELSVPEPAEQEPAVNGELSRLVVSTFPMPAWSCASGAERRQGERHECEFEVEFLSDTHFMTGITQDLSEGGIFIATYQRLPIGTEVGLAFELPGDRRVEVKGAVRWIRKECGETRPGLGIAFTELSHEALARITAHCAAGSSRYYEF